MWPPLAVVAFTMIPFLLWAPSDFVQSVLRVQLVQPFRPESLAFPALVAQSVGTPHSLAVTVLQGVAVVGTIVVCLRRSPVGPHGFALASALILVVLYATSKQAFPNYYSLAIGLLFLGASASLSHVEEAHVDAEISETPIIESPSSTGR